METIHWKSLMCFTGRKLVLFFIQPKGDQSWVFIGGTDFEAETPVLWPPDVKS